MQLFFANRIEESLVFLSEEESHHCIKVLRKKTGDELNVTDGKGKLWKTKIVAVESHIVKASILSLELEQNASDNQLHIAICPTKNADRIEWFLEKAIEIGVQKISFIFSERTERKNVNLDRLQKISQSACKQSLELNFPEVNVYAKLNDFINQFSSEKNKYIAHLQDENTEYLGRIWNKKLENALVLIGPEGDFSIKEIETCLKSGFKAVSLGDKRLRTETAGVMVAGIFSTIKNLKNEE